MLAVTTVDVGHMESKTITISDRYTLYLYCMHCVGEGMHEDEQWWYLLEGEEFIGPLHVS